MKCPSHPSGAEGIQLGATTMTILLLVCLAGLGLCLIGMALE